MKTKNLQRHHDGECNAGARRLRPNTEPFSRHAEAQLYLGQKPQWGSKRNNLKDHHSAVEPKQKVKLQRAKRKEVAAVGHPLAVPEILCNSETIARVLRTLVYISPGMTSPDGWQKTLLRRFDSNTYLLCIREDVVSIVQVFSERIQLLRCAGKFGNSTETGPNYMRSDITVYLSLLLRAGVPDYSNIWRILLSGD